MKAYEGMFSSSEKNKRLTCSGHSHCGRFNKATQSSSDPQCWLPRDIVPEVVHTAEMFPLWNTCFIQYLSHSIDQKYILFKMGALYQQQQYSLSHTFFESWLPLAIPVVVLKAGNSVPICIFHLQLLSQLSFPSVGIVNRPLHTSCFQMRPQTRYFRFYPFLYLLLMLVSPTFDVAHLT